MQKRTVSFEEQETTFNLWPARMGKCEIYSCEPDMIKQIKKLAKEHPEDVVITGEDDISIFAEAPRSYFKFTPPRKYNLSEERREQLRESIKRINKNAN